MIFGDNLTDEQKARVYDLEPAQREVHVRIAQLGKAKRELEKAEREFRNEVAKIYNVPVAEITFSNVVCMARHIPYHAYHNGRCLICGSTQD